MRTPPRLLSLLFLVALLGVLLAGGLLSVQVGGVPLLLGYLVVVGVLLGLGVMRIRRLASPPAAPGCACCDGDHAKPVTVR